jgi:squalene-associated FAD-dependent desaturase
MNVAPPQPTVAIAGGGLAGLAAACALADSGFRVTIFERRPYLGGRASSYEHPGTGEVVDNCQHILFRICTNLVEFYRRIGVEDKIHWFDTMTFIEPSGRQSIMRSSPLPAPLHTAPSFLLFPFLDAEDKLAISRGIAALILTTPRDTGESFLNWCRHHHQTENAIDLFWKPILISALSEDLDLISIAYAAQVVRESMKTPAARLMGVPTLPLTELYNRAGDYVQARGGQILFRASLEAFCPDSSRVVIRAGGKEQAFDYLIAALPFDILEAVLPQDQAAASLREKISHFKYAPITGIHLWFDRQVTDLPHAVLLNRTIQWMFHKSMLLSHGTKGAKSEDLKGRSFSCTDSTHISESASAAVGNPSYLELVVSSSKSLIEKSRPEIIDLALHEVREFFPGARDANLVKSTVIKELKAVYSPRPGIDAHRPSQSTPWPRVFLAGDWTATGWPATMEGAVRSGYLAAEALLLANGMKDARILVSDLPASGLMSLFQK